LKRPFEGTILETHTKKGRGIRGNLGFLQKEGACGETLVSRN